MKTFVITATLCAFGLIGFGVFMIADLLITGLIYFAWWLAVMAVLTPAYIGILSWRRQSNNHMRQRDGAYPRYKHFTDPLPKRIWQILHNIQPEYVIHDPNKDPGCAVRFNGKVEFLEPAAGWANQMAYAELGKKLSIAQAAFPGDDAISSRYGSEYRPGGAGAAHRILSKLDQRPAGKIIDVQPTPPLQIEMDAEPVQPELSPQTAFAKCQEIEGIAYIGQQQDGLRKLATWNANDANTLGVFGATGTGKTTCVGNMVALSMIAWGWRVFILDGKDAGDWDEYADHASVLPFTPGNALDIVRSLEDEYRTRERLMNKYRARRYYHLPTELQQEYPQWGMIIEEYGSTRARMKTSVQAQFDGFIDELCSKARYTGWHGVFNDQRPTNYTEVMKGNLKSIVCFQTAMNQGYAVNAYEAHKLAPKGEFEMNEQRYFAFHAEPMVVGTLRRLPMLNGSATVQPLVQVERSMAVQGTITPVPPPAADELNGLNDAPVDLSPTELQAAVWAWRDANPLGTQADARNEFEHRRIKISRGHVFNCWHAWPGNQPASAAEQLAAQGIDWNAVRLPGGDKLGVDISYNGAKNHGN